MCLIIDLDPEMIGAKIVSLRGEEDGDKVSSIPVRTILRIERTEMRGM